MLANKRHGEFSGNYDVKLAASLGAEVAVSLENTFLFEETRQQALRLDASMEMLRQVSQALDSIANRLVTCGAKNTPMAVTISKIAPKVPETRAIMSFKSS